jgi:GT2 family glycosyltransferase
MLHIISPYDNEKNLGRAYNEAMKYYNADDWVCLKDHDTLFLLPDTIRHISRYTELFPNAGILTCYTNRLANGEQLASGRCDEDDSIRNHIWVAGRWERDLYKTTILKKPISGFLMVIRKSTWDRVKFDDGCLGVDNKYHLKIVAAGMDVLRMNGIYVWHTYRLLNGVKNKSHLV